MQSEKIKSCLDQCFNEFNKNFVNATYENTRALSESILDLTRALSYQLQIEEKYKFESEEE
jgi:hypothetical protein